MLFGVLFVEELPSPNVQLTELPGVKPVEVLVKLIVKGTPPLNVEVAILELMLK